MDVCDGLPELRRAEPWLPRSMGIHVRLRKHSALGCRSPKQRHVALLAESPGQKGQLARLLREGDQALALPATDWARFKALDRA